MNLIIRLMHAIGDRANPVVVKELRQAVQSKLVIGILMLFLLANVTCIGVYLVSSNDVTKNENAGRELFGILYVVLVVTCMVFVPLYAAIRLTMERNDANMDLVFITTIAPGAIIRGKFTAALALSALIYSVCTPFLTFTYLLRGIDLPTIFFTLFMAFSVTALVIMLAIFTGSIAGSLLLRFFLGAGLLGMGGMLLSYVCFGGVVMANMGVASAFAGADAWGVLGLCALLWCVAWGLLYLLAVAAVSPRSSNRMFPLRVYLTVCWLLSGAILTGWAFYEKQSWPVAVWLTLSIIVLCTAMIFALSEREEWTPRIRRGIPTGFFRRTLAWFFYTGSAGAVLWCLGLGLATIVIGYLATSELRVAPYYGLRDEPLDVMFGVLLFTWCYSQSGLLVRRLLAPRTSPAVGTAITLLLLAVGSSLPLFAAYLMFGPSWQFERLPISLLIVDPFVLERNAPGDREVVLFSLAIWGLGVFLVNVPWFRRQWLAFERYEPRPAAEPEPVVAEPSVAHA